MPNIHQRKSDKYYYVRIPIGKDENGKYQYDTLYDKKKSVLEQKIKEYEKNKGLDKASVTLSEWTYKRLFEHMHSDVTHSTFNGYVSLYETHIKNSQLGKMELKSIKQSHIDKFLKELKSNGKYTKGEPLAASSVKKVKFLINTVLKSAVADDKIAKNPMDGLKLPKNTKKEKSRTALTVNAQKAYIKACEDEKYGFLYILALATGMRMGELIALKWDNVDLDHNIITVVEAIKYTTVYEADGTSHKEHITKAPKSESGIRKIPIPKSLIIKFKELKLQSSYKYVFATCTGRPLNQGNINRTHKSICNRANIEPIPFHSLRHTYATRLLEAGENFKTVQVLLGHADITTTMNIYAHVLEDTKISTADKLDKILNQML